MRHRMPFLAAGLLALAASCASPEQPPEGRLRYRMPTDPPTLDPFQAGDDNSLVYAYLIFDGLVEFVPGSTAVRPAVASSWTVSTDGLTYTFSLRPGVRFHDGRPVTARDVVYSARRALTPKTSAKDGFFEALAGKHAFWTGASPDLAGVRALDDRTVAFTLAHPYGPFLTVLASEAGSILPEEVYSAPSQSWLQTPVGCGPYRLAARQPGVSLTLERFEGHWKAAPEGALRTLEFRIIHDASTALAEYRAGGIDFTQEIPPGHRAAVREELASHFHNSSRLSLFYFGFNHAAPPFGGNATLRRAVAHAVDRDFIVRVLQEEKDLPAAGVITPAMLGHDPERRPVAHDPGLSSRLLAEAGHPEGRGLPEIDYLTNDTESFRRIADRLQADLARVGIRIRIKTMDLGAFIAALSAGGEAHAGMGLFRMNWYADWPDPDNFLGLQFSTGASGNFGRYSNPVFDELIAAGRREPDATRRGLLYRQADTLLIQDAALVPVYWYGQDALLRPSFRGMTLSPLGTFAIAWEEVVQGT
ncbi:MAG TPA: ABC transporter substrate-binding protein [Candidatus Polarisedimenticolia bacterium]|nr:ABC transporter substrate-binding protein [Candidatus Polarisedimenticolia bacterium]